MPAARRGVVLGAPRSIGFSGSGLPAERAAPTVDEPCLRGATFRARRHSLIVSVSANSSNAVMPVASLESVVTLFSSSVESWCDNNVTPFCCHELTHSRQRVATRRVRSSSQNTTARTRNDAIPAFSACHPTLRTRVCANGVAVDVLLGRPLHSVRSLCESSVSD